jgi:hypothetical protein
VGNLQARYYHLFSVLISHVGGHKIEYDHEMEMKVIRQLITNDTKCCQLVIEKLASREDKSLNCDGNYGEKQ